jgi:hypothetical protein
MRNSLLALWRIVLVFLVLATSAAVACPGRPSPNFDAQYSQRRSQPILQGIGYDVPGERVFISACRRRAYACDLLVASLNGPADQEAAYFRGPSGRYGYIWPAISPDGRNLAVVRTIRNQRPSQRDVTHELVNIDLRTGAEIVLASAGEGRFDRVVYADNQTIMAVRSFRSSPSVRCTPDYCTDWAEVLLIRGGETERLPLELAGPPFKVSITPLGGQAYWIDASTRQIEYSQYGFPSGHGINWVLDMHAGLSAGATRLPAMLELLRQVERRNGSLGGWPQSIFTTGQVGLSEGQPFCGTLTELAALSQTALADSQRGVFVAKVRVGGRMRFQIGRMENRGAIPWALVSEDTASYPAR